MAVEIANDRAILLADFGVTVTWGLNTFTAIFDNMYTAEDLGGSVAIAMTQPKLLCRTADINGMAEGDSITVESVNYYVRVIMPDGTGMSELMLEKQ